MIALRSIATVALVAVTFLTSCAAAPKEDRKDDVLAGARSSRYWFERHVTGLNSQIRNSAGYIVFPDVAQWGIIFGGGSFGRGAFFDNTGKHVGWAVINNASVGLQAGVQGFKMLMVLENEAEVAEFKNGKWNGSASGVAVLGEEGASAAAPFQEGLAVYQGANSGLMAGVNVGLNNIRYEAK